MKKYIDHPPAGVEARPLRLFDPFIFFFRCPSPLTTSYSLNYNLHFGVVKPQVFIIILNHNTPEDVLECVSSVQNTDYPNFKIVVVDNGSEAQFLERLKRNLPSKIKLIETGENLGFAGGNNIGIKYALDHGADWVMLLNPDTVVDKHFLRKLINVSKKEPKAGLLGPKIYYYNEPQKIWFGGGKFGWIRGGRHLGWGKFDKKALKDKLNFKQVDYITGCALLIKKEVFEKIGLLAEEYFLYYEDTDFSLRSRKAGFKVIYVPGAKVWHKVSQTTKTFGDPLIHRYHTRNALLLVKRNAPFYIRIGVGVWSFWVFLKQSIKIIFLPQRREIAWAIIAGLKDYYQGRFGRIER